MRTANRLHPQCTLELRMRSPGGCAIRRLCKVAATEDKALHVAVGEGGLPALLPKPLRVRLLLLLDELDGRLRRHKQHRLPVL